MRVYLRLIAFIVVFLLPGACLAGDTFPPQAAFQSLLKQQKTAISGDEAVNGLAQDCLTALSAHNDPDSVQRAGTIVKALISRADTDADGVGGWGLNSDETESECDGPGTMPGFKPGTCDGVGTAEMFRTGLAISCLARYGLATGDQTAISAARQAADDSWAMGGVDVPCKGCFTYWPTYSANDQGHYVRNRSVLMGMGLAWLYRATHDQKYAYRARAVAHADAWEVAQGNKGYFSKMDPQYQAKPWVENERVENHTPLVAKGLLDIGRILKDDDAIKNAGVVIDQWMTCDTKMCQTKPCKYWAADLDRCNVPDSLRSCLIRKTSPKAAAHCARASAQIPNWGPDTLWYMFDE